MASKNHATMTFTTVYGATVTVPADQAAACAMLKTEQVAALNTIISDHTSGFQIELTPNDIITLTGLASELAHAAMKLVAAGSTHIDAKAGA